MIRLKKRLPVLLMIVVIIPGVIISIIGFSLVSQQKSARLLDIKEDYTNRVFNTGRRIESETRKLVETVFRQAESNGINLDEPESLIDFIKRLLLDHHIIKYPFLLDSNKRFLFPITRKSKLPMPLSPDLGVEISNIQVKGFYNDGYNFEYRKRDFVSAIRAYLKALKANSEVSVVPYIHHAMGRCYFKLNQFRQAVFYYRRVLSDNSGSTGIKKDRLLHLTTLRQLAVSHKNDGDMELAALVFLTLYEESLRFDTPPGQGHMNPYAFFKNEALSYLNRYSRKQSLLQDKLSDNELRTTPAPVRELAELSQLDVSLRWLFFEDEADERVSGSDTNRSQTPDADYRFLKLQELFESSDQKTRFYRRLKTALKFPEGIDAGITYLTMRGHRPGHRLYIALKPWFSEQPRHGTVYFGFLLSAEYIRTIIFPRSEREHVNTPGTMVDSDSLAPDDQNNDVAELLTVPFQSLFHGSTLSFYSKFSRFFEDRVKKDIRLYYLLLSALVLALVSGSFLFYKYLSRESELVRLKAEFVDSASHTLKTPLTRMSLMAENVARGWVTGEEQKKEFFHKIMSETGRMSEMIDNMLNFSRIEAGKQYYQPESLYIQEITLDVIESYSQQLKEKKFQTDVTIDDDLPPLMLDRKAAKLILNNLLQNAVKYSINEKHIKIRIFRENDRAVLEVGDRGIGIPKKDLPHIFKKFTRVNDDTVKAVEGSGLGLYLVRHAVEAHKGKIKAESIPMQGTLFKVVFPLFAKKNAKDAKGRKNHP